MSEKKAKQKRQRTGNWYYRLELSKKTSLWGIIFLMPWILGFLVFFLKPLVESILYSFNTVKIVPNSGVSMDFVGWDNYVRAFQIDPIFSRLLFTMLTTTLPQVAIVVIFSLLVAILLNGKFPGRRIARTIFFIPIIMGTNIATAKLAGTDAVSLEIAGATNAPGAFGSEFIIDILMNTGLPTELVGYVTGAITGIFSILGISGVPILIFLAGLQSISSSLYEVAKIEGSTAYETFWKVTFPMISPMILLSSIYSIIDAFSKHSTVVNGTQYGMVTRMYSIAFDEANYGLSASMTISYLLISIAVIGVVSFLISRVVFYYD